MNVSYASYAMSCKVQPRRSLTADVLCGGDDDAPAVPDGFLSSGM
jgi:hypothetical protein